MAIDWSLDSDTGITTFTAEGTVDGDTFIRVAREVYDTERDSTYTLHLWDLRGLTGPPDTPDINKIAHFVRYNRPPVPGKIALVAATDLVFGLLRMYEVFLDQVAVDTHAFRTTAEAVQWLLGGDAK